MSVEITDAGSDRRTVLASMFGRAFVDEPMMRWPLGDHGDIEARFTRCFDYFLEDLEGSPSCAKRATQRGRRSGCRLTMKTLFRRHKRNGGCTL